METMIAIFSTFYQVGFWSLLPWKTDWSKFNSIWFYGGIAYSRFLSIEVGLYESSENTK